MTEQQKQEAKKYRDELAACDCLEPKRKAFIQSAMDRAEDLPDGAWLASLEEEGIDVTELECFSTTHYAETHAKTVVHS